MTLQLEMKLNNSAFTDIPEAESESETHVSGNEIARILRVLAKKVETSGTLTAGEIYILRDINGNRVGQATVEE